MVVLTVSATAATPKKKASKKKANVAKVDTIDVKRFSYLMGRINTEGLKPYLVQQKGVDTTYMAQFIDGFNQDEMTTADKLFARFVGFVYRFVGIVYRFVGIVRAICRDCLPE